MKNFFTKEGYQKLQKELAILKKEKRQEIAEKIKDFQDLGDINENPELEEIRNEQAFLEGRIQELEFLLKGAQIIENSSQEIIGIGSRVVLLAEEEILEYVLVGLAESDPENGKISIESPLGQALCGHKKGETISVDTISGPHQYQIIDIK